MPSHLVIMVVERNELLIPRALRFSMVDCKISQLLALPSHWVEACLAQLVSALALAGTLLHQHLGHRFSIFNFDAIQFRSFSTSTWVIRQHFRVSNFLAPPFSPILALVTGAIITTSSNSTNMVELSRDIATISQELSSHEV